MSPTVSLPCPRALDPVRVPASGGGRAFIVEASGPGGIGLLSRRSRERKRKKEGYFAKSCAWPGWQADGAVLWNHLHVV